MQRQGVCEMCSLPAAEGLMVCILKPTKEDFRLIFQLVPDPPPPDLSHTLED